MYEAYKDKRYKYSFVPLSTTAFNVSLAEGGVEGFEMVLKVLLCCTTLGISVVVFLSIITEGDVKAVMTAHAPYYFLLLCTVVYCIYLHLHTVL